MSEGVRDANLKSLHETHQTFLADILEFYARHKFQSFEAASDAATLPLSSRELNTFLSLPVKYFKKITAYTENLSKNEFVEHVKKVLASEKTCKMIAGGISALFVVAAAVVCWVVGDHLTGEWQTGNVASIFGGFIASLPAAGVYRASQHLVRSVRPVPTINLPPPQQKP